MTGKIGLLIKKFSVPALLLILGLIMVFVGITSEQDMTFKLAAIMMLLAGLISLLYSTGKLNPKMIVLTGVVCGIVAVATFYLSGKSVIDTTIYEKNYEKCRLLAIQNLEDIRYVQKAYMEKNGKYIDNWDEFVNYTKTGTVPKVVSKGIVPDTFITPEERDYIYGDNRPIDEKMNEIEAYKLSKWPEGPRYERMFGSFIRDTIEITFAESKFNTKSYKRSREVMGFNPFSVDSLPYIPFTGAREMWSLEVKDSIMMGETKFPAIRVEGAIPFAKTQGEKNEKLSFGSLETNETSGSWEE